MLEILVFKRSSALLVLIGILYGTASVSAEAPFRLPRTVIPQTYRIDLTIVPDRERFAGHVEIDVQLAAPTEVIWLHGRDLDIAHASLEPRGGSAFPVAYEQITRDGMSRLILGRTLEPQQVTLRFDYTAPFSDSLNGIYKVRVGDDDYVFSQFESVDARKVIPSFDEPLFKTPFEVSVTTQAQDRVFFNTQAVEIRELQDEMRQTRYASTLPLSTYLLAFAVGPFDVVEWDAIAASPYRDTPIPLRGITVRGQGPRIHFALKQTGSLVLRLEEYFATAYPFDKLDIVAVPDFSSGAMENAGLITYRESLILLDEASAVSQKRSQIRVHAHELSHQWFGNLVTMPWWNDVWLKEAFASWIQARIADAEAPEYHFDRDTQIRAIRAMTIDGLVSTRQIREPVNSTDDIEAAYDGIIYRKGAGVLSMLEAYVGEESFRAGLRDYMRRFAFGSATVYDLMDSLQRVVGDGLEVEAVFESFLFQPGVPYLTVASRCDGDTLRVDIEQARYLPLGSRGDPAQLWTVPVCLAWGDGDEREDTCVLLAEQHETYAFPVGGHCPEWLMPNANGAGYLRWWVGNTDAEALAAVFQTQLNTAERVSFADSIVAGVRAGSVSIPEFLAQLPALAGASEPDVVSQPLAVYREMYHELLSPETRPAAGRFAVDTFGPILATLDSGDSSMSPADAAIMRYRLTRLLAVDIGVPDTVAMLTGIAHRYLGYPAGTPPDASVLDPDLLRPTLIAAARDGDAAFTTHLMQVFRESSDSHFRLAVMAALAFVTDPEIVTVTREFALGPDVRGNELSRWLYWILNPGSRSVNWPWVREHLGDILAAGNASIGRNAPDSFGHWLCRAEDADALERIFSPYIEAYPGSETKLRQTLEHIELCIAFRDHQAEAANAYFLERIKN